MTRIWLAIAGLGGFLSVAAGAVSAHLARDPHAEELLRTGALYGMVHAAALTAIALRGGPARPALALAAWAFAAGIVLFSCSLFGLALSGLGWLAVATPFGGVALMLGWLGLAFAAVRRG
jgi:uncharacterized membrane protein YgdD (TMEM256/DUF423 family)